ncbi:uncharacterized protein LOC120359849 isoform X2 [Solenopsis invicta]|uniref:uncharacterized protein LOC120359849 isoform X2 n=1 Tax=Solenopsis invicta TaxID=13686 RepID=UPI00193E3573|nr:uncharacterized protein LOC120359849 isoform X2 [Solenopsis invicta]
MLAFLRNQHISKQHFCRLQNCQGKMQKSECTSDLNSEIDVRRKRPSKRLLSSSDDEEDRTLPTPPLLKLTGAQNKKKTKSQFNLSSNESDASSVLHDEPANILDNRISSNNLICTCKHCPIHKELQNNNVTYFKEIIRQQHPLKAEIWQQSDNLRIIKNAVENPNYAHFNNADDQEAIFFYSYNIPMDNERQLEQMEGFLKTDENFNTSILEASKIGGNNAYEFIKRNLSQIFTNKLASEYSWEKKINVYSDH